MLNQQIGQYKIIQLLGEGGMAIVYLAEKGNLGKKVALKVLKEDFLSNRQIRGRFLAEARNMIRLNHPNIVAINDLIDEPDFVAIELEYIEGETLKEYLQEKGPLQDTVIEHLFRQMVSAVQYIHEKGFVHRDIKPSNFMLSSNNIIKLTDFGIAKNTNEGSKDYTQTETLAILGTPKYMSPEQFISTKDVTVQSDIYSLGVVLWEMITRQSPYNIQSENWVEIFKKIENDSLDKTDTKWDEVIENATRKEINERLIKIQVWADYAGLDKKGDILMKIETDENDQNSFLGSFKYWLLLFAVTSILILVMLLSTGTHVKIYRILKSMS